MSTFAFPIQYCIGVENTDNIFDDHSSKCNGHICWIKSVMHYRLCKNRLTFQQSVIFSAKWNLSVSDIQDHCKIHQTTSNYAL